LEGIRAAASTAAGVAGEWIRIAIAAASRRHLVTLFQAGIAAAAHSGGDVGAAIVNSVTRTCSRRGHCHRYKSQRRQCRWRGGYFQKSFHFVSLFLFGIVVFAVCPNSEMGCAGSQCYRIKKKVKESNSALDKRQVMQRGAALVEV
jgi:hypothetical protein